jgi:hypothetical protein
MVAKIVSRWGLDGAFMRFFHERPTGGPLERLTSTIVWFIVAADLVVFGAALAVFRMDRTAVVPGSCSHPRVPADAD